MRWRARLPAITRRRLAVAAAILLAPWLAWRAFRASVGAPSLDASRFAEGTRVLARDGRELGERPSRAGLRGRPVHLADVGPRLVAATLTSEDRGFRSHDGVDRAAVARALATDARHARLVSGGSTITQQVVKRLDHEGRPRPRTIAAKVKEIARAQNLEAAASKDAILEAYFDVLDYGHGLAGPEAAARGYFGVAARDLSWAQAALLAVLPRAPSALDPYRHLARARGRQQALLRAMHARGDLSSADLERALAEPLVLAPRPSRALVAPHVVLAAARGAPGGEVRTTLDKDLQSDVEVIVRSHAAALRARAATGVAVVVLDNATGEVLAEVGSAGYFDAPSAGAVDLARARRQAGSTLKPFVYARAFERGVSPMAVLEDVPTEIGTTGAVYAPDNFDGTFVGPVSAREALAGSLNVPAVRLAERVGVADLIATLSSVGLRIDGGAQRHGLALALGSAEVSPRELAGAYATLARGGRRVIPRDRLAERAGDAPSVVDATAAALVADALSDPLARVRGLRARGPFELPFPTAVKTGTSTGFRDAWTAGFTAERTVVVWVGNANGAPTDHLTGATGAGPVFFDVMKRAMSSVGARGPLYDASLVEEADVCPLSGERPGPACADHVRRVFARGASPRETCTMHRHARALSAAEAARPGGPRIACDPDGKSKVVVLPEAFGRFLAAAPPGAPGLDPHGAPAYLASSVAGCSDAEGGEPRVTVVRPAPGAVVRAEGGPAGTDVVEVVAETRGLPAGTPLEVVLDGKVVARMQGTYAALVPVSLGDHDLEVRPGDPRSPARLGRAAIRVR
jgi:penicillin-binding protein 1C